VWVWLKWACTGAAQKITAAASTGCFDWGHSSSEQMSDATEDTVWQFYLKTHKSRRVWQCI